MTTSQLLVRVANIATELGNLAEEVDRNPEAVYSPVMPREKFSDLLTDCSCRLAEAFNTKKK